MTEESAHPKLPLFARVDEINNPYSNFIDIFGINTSDDVKATIRNLQRLLLIYHPDYCSKLKGYTTEEEEKCKVISQKIDEIRKKLAEYQSYDFLKQLQPSRPQPSRPQPPPPEKPTQTKSVKDSLGDVIDTTNLEQTRKFYMNLLNQPKILKLANQILLALMNKYPTLVSGHYQFWNALESVAKNVTLSFFDDDDYDFDSLQQQILAFIEKSERLPNGKYKLHDIIDLVGYDRQNLGHDYCVALNIFFNLMQKVFGFNNTEPAPTFGISSFYTHKDRCMDTSYSPEPTKGSGLSFKNTRVNEDIKFKKLQTNLSIHYLTIGNNSIFIPSFTDAEGDVAAEAEGGSKSRRRHRRHRKPVRKTRRGRGHGRGRTRKSKSKRQIRAQKYKKNTYKRCK